jgi:hypothetical protein
MIIGWTGAVMEKTRIFRTCCSRVLVTALTIQALTPDALDLTLLAQCRPPGPVLVLLSLFAEERDEEDELSQPGVPDCDCPSRLYSSSDHRDRTKELPAELWQPLWPEVGLARNPNKTPCVLLPARLIWHELITEIAPVRWEGRHNGWDIPSRDLYCSLCRITC